MKNIINLLIELAYIPATKLELNSKIQKQSVKIQSAFHCHDISLLKQALTKNKKISIPNERTVTEI